MYFLVSGWHILPANHKQFAVSNFGKYSNPVFMVAAIGETKVQRSQRSCGNHSPAVVAIAKMPRCNTYAHPFQDGCLHEYREFIEFGTFYVRSAKIRLPLSNWGNIRPESRSGPDQVSSILSQRSQRSCGNHQSRRSPEPFFLRSQQSQRSHENRALDCTVVDVSDCVLVGGWYIGGSCPPRLRENSRFEDNLSAKRRRSQIIYHRQHCSKTTLKTFLINK